MNQTSRMAIVIFLTPIIAALFYTLYYRESRRSLMDRLIDSGVIAMFDGGIVTRDDLQNYFQYPPVIETSMLRSLELNPDEVKDIGLHEKDRELFKEQAGQLLLNQVIKHVAMIEYLVSIFDQNDNPELEQEIQSFRESLMVEAMEKDLAKISPTVTQEEMLAYYVNHPDDFYRKGKRFARHIMLYPNENESQDDNPFHLAPDQIWTRLQNGEDFHSLIIETRSESSTHDGILGWVERGTLHHDFERALWALDIGEITGPIQVNSTIHFIQLLDEEKEGLIPFEQCRPDIRNLLKEKKRVVHRYKLLGLNPEEFDEGSQELNDEYQKKLLEAAYARGWDKHIDIVKKTNAYTHYRQADYMFREQMDKHRNSQNFIQNQESSWILESRTANKILKDIHFRLLIKLDIPGVGTLDHDMTPEE